MKLSKSYSNKPDIFPAIRFNPGLNVILAEIRLPENRNKDTHNLGKTTLIHVLDFCLLKKIDKKFVMKKHGKLFEDFVFFLEIELLNNRYLTIKRGVKPASKISIAYHDQPDADFNKLLHKDWDHENIPIEKAKNIIDSQLNLQALKPWTFRNIIGYLLRTQTDYSDEFQLSKFKSKHKDWKPFVSHLIGFDHQLISEFYDKEEKLENINVMERSIKSELGESLKDINRIDSLLLIKKDEEQDKQKLLDQFDFRKFDKEKTKETIDVLDSTISDLNTERYSVQFNIKKIQNSIKQDDFLFETEKVKPLFEEVGVLFEGQIKKDYEKLIEFNRSITEERKQYLEIELSELKQDLSLIHQQLNTANKQRNHLLTYLCDSDVFQKYKIISEQLVQLKTDIKILEKHRDDLERLGKEKRSIKVEIDKLTDKIKSDIQNQNINKSSIYSITRLKFNEIIKQVIDKSATLSASLNEKNHIEFDTEIQDSKGKATSESSGHTYKKFMCIAFDLALIASYINKSFPRFIYHDGIFESLDDRKKENLLELMRDFSNLGLQHIVTSIDSDLPQRPKNDPVFTDDEIILRLHDEGKDGRLFKMDSW